MENEKRLIDADELYEKIQEAYRDAGYYRPIYEGFLNTIDRMPTEVVYCKDCARFNNRYCTIKKDSWGGALSRGYHDFCSDGERRNNEVN